MAELEPRWVGSFREWWDDLLGPVLSTVLDQVLERAGDSALAEKAYGASVRRFEAELDGLEADVAAFRAAAGATEWAPYAERVAEVFARVQDRWRDPAATTSLVAGPGVGTLLRGLNVAVTVIGVAWAVASLAEVLRARKLLRSWGEDLAKGVLPGRRAAKRAGLPVQGVEGRPFRRRVRPGRRRPLRRRRGLPPGVELDEPDFDDGTPDLASPWSPAPPWR